MVHRHQHRISVGARRGARSFSPERFPERSSPFEGEEDVFSAVEGATGSPSEWLFLGLVSGQVDPTQVQGDELDALLDRAKNQLKNDTPQGCTDVLAMLSSLLASAHSPEIGIPVSTLLVETFLVAGTEMKMAIRKCVPDIDELVTITSSQRAFH